MLKHADWATAHPILYPALCCGGASLNPSQDTYATLAAVPCGSAQRIPASHQPTLLNLTCKLQMGPATRSDWRFNSLRRR